MTREETQELVEINSMLLEACESMLDWMEWTIPRLKGKCPYCQGDIDRGRLNWGAPLYKARTAIAKCKKDWEK